MPQDESGTSEQQIQLNRRNAYLSSLRRRNLILDTPVQIKWKVSTYRTDKRTGATSYRPLSAYMQKQYNKMMRKWGETYDDDNESEIAETASEL